MVFGTDFPGQRRFALAQPPISTKALSRMLITNSPTPGSLLARGPATLRIFTRFSAMKPFSLSAATRSPAQRCSQGLLCLCANSTVFFEPPVKVGSIENKTVASLSRTFHSVRWMYEPEGVSFSGYFHQSAHLPPSGPSGTIPRIARCALAPNPGQPGQRRFVRRKQF